MDQLTGVGPDAVNMHRFDVEKLADPKGTILRFK